MLSRDAYYRARFDKVPPAPPYQDKGADLITVHEQTHGDGVFDQHKIVLSGLNMANAVLRGHGGIWVMNTPYLMFYPDANGDDIPDRDPEVRLAGFGLEDAHAVSNGLIWGPDGWLYGCQGSTTTSRVRRPGIDPLGAGVYSEGCIVWRYHPEKKIYEVFAEGGGNNFGLDFDAEGRLFSGHNGGVTHGWYFIQGGLYLKAGFDSGKYGPPANPYAFGSLPQMKSHNPIPRFTHDIVMFEGTALPSQYVGKMFGADPLHRLLTLSERTTVGSSFETRDIGTPLTSGDITFRPVYLTNAPDGALYIADFCEEYIAHGQHYQGQIDPTSGRIYRLRGKGMPLNKDVNLAAKTTGQLVQLLSHPNLWQRQTAVRLLGERRDASAIEPLRSLLKMPNTHPALEALWALYQMDALDEQTSLAALSHPAGPVRAWVVRLMGDARSLSPAFYAALQNRIATESDPEVRAQIAATSRRLPAGQALPIVAALLKHDADAGDGFIPMLCWWTLEAHCDIDREVVISILKEPEAWRSAVMKQSILSRLMRRFAGTGTHGGYLACARLLEMAPTAEDRKILAGGFEEALQGRALPAIPQELAAALAQSGQASPLLRVRLGEPAAIEAALKVAGDPTAKYDDRLGAVQVFGEVKTTRAVPILLAVADEKTTIELRKAALNSLQLYDDDAIGKKVAGFYSDLPAEVRPAALNLLASRPAWSLALLSRIDRGQIKFTTMPFDVLARLRAQQDPAVAKLVNKLFPATRPAAKTTHPAEIARVRSIIDSGSGDPYKGEAFFMQRCAACHTLFFKGGNIGPNLTSYQRDDLSTMLISIIDPSAEIREGYQNYLLKTRDGRTLSGFLSDHDADIVTIRGLDGQDTRISRSDIAELKAMPTSIMPEGLLEGLSDQQLRDFFAYLRIPQPISR
jgi:putative membrane-bound dehydrogenase-like protein